MSDKNSNSDPPDTDLPDPDTSDCQPESKYTDKSDDLKQCYKECEEFHGDEEDNYCSNI